MGRRYWGFGSGIIPLYIDITMLVPASKILSHEERILIVLLPKMRDV